MNRIFLLLSALAVASTIAPVNTSNSASGHEGQRWIGTWATAPQPVPGTPQVFQNQTLRLVVHTSAGGTRVRIKLSNTFGDRPLLIGGAHLARRTAAANVDPVSDRVLTFRGRPSTRIPPHAVETSDPVDLEAPAMSDLAISLFLPEATTATTSHLLALQTSYVSPAIGDVTAAAQFPVAKTLVRWPFLTGVDVAASVRGASVVAFGSSTTDGDGATRDANRRWPDVLARRLQESGGRHAELGVLNLGIIGNRLLYDSPSGPGNPFGPALGQAGLARFERDVLGQSGVRYLIVGLGVNDIIFPAFPFTPSTETITAHGLISGYRQLIARARHKRIRVIGTTIPPFEHATFEELRVSFYTPERERVRQMINTWIRTSGAFDAVVDFDAVLREPSRPTQLRPQYDKGDHLHFNDAGNSAVANAIPLSLFDGD